MVGVAQDDAGVHGLQFFRRHGLDRRLRADGHECRCFKRTVRRVDDPQACAGLFTGLDVFVRYCCCHW